MIKPFWHCCYGCGDVLLPYGQACQSCGHQTALPVRYAGWFVVGAELFAFVFIGKKLAVADYTTQGGKVSVSRVRTRTGAAQKLKPYIIKMIESVIAGSGSKL